MNKIKFYRLVLEMTQKELAKEIGYTQALVSMLETGKVLPGKKIKAAMAKAMAKALNKSEKEIFNGVDSV